MKISVNSPCPCHSGKKYKKCCQAYHKGANPSNAMLLMRSRYSAYALRLSKYIIDTTHPNNSDFTNNIEQWGEGILGFCDNTNFEGLKILEFVDGENEAYVKFDALLSGAHFIEKSRFLKVEGRWLYESAEFEQLHESH
ncbi:MAG: YchJ family metal-binding protein [Sulfurovaceae bacterium]|nr:YchJ family metal-binding protein [Sulfurovaceae bacterium]